MKLLIATDMEGVTGVVGWDQVTPGHAEWPRFRRLLTQDINAAIAGASRAGADEIYVADGHWNSDNILIEELDPRARLLCGTPSPFSMVSGVENGTDAAFFIGYHAHAGSENAILDHTWSNSMVANLWINGRLTGEGGLNGAVCGHFNVPVLMLSGDQTVCAEAREWIDGIETAQVKRATGRYSAECLSPEASQKLIRETAERAIKRFKAGNAARPLKVGNPVTITIEFFYSDMADRAVLYPGSKRLDGRRVEVSAPDMAAAYLAFRGALGMGRR
jgi:D-amino peptidase